MYKIKTIFLKRHNKKKYNKLKKYKRLHEGAWGSLLHVLFCSNATEHRPNVVPVFISVASWQAFV